jgi:bifunctional non-homologous end joining protein LigD
VAATADALIKPMLAVPGELPTVRVDEWAAEMKWDGVRAVTYVSGSKVRVFSRNDRDVSVSYPELDVLARAVNCDVVLDGEIVAMDDDGRPNFGLLQSRMHVADPAKVAKLRSGIPVNYLLFDVLRIDGKDVLSVPYANRRDLLDQLDISGECLAVPPAFKGDPAHAMRASLETGLEGVVCKRLDSVYQPGRRSPAWVKVKHQRMQEVVIIGWEPGEGRRKGEVGALLLGVNVDGELHYAGQVGTGFTDRVLTDLRKRLEPLGTKVPPAPDVPREHSRNAHWVRPQLVGEVVFGEWTRDNRLRHPSWRGLRPDKAPGDVVRES